MGFPSDFLFFGYYYFFFCIARKKMANEEEGVYMVCCSHLQESKGGEKEELQDVGIYTLLLQILTFKYKKSV